MSKKTSFVWNFFHIKDNEKQMAECELCRTLLCFKSSVSNLKKHLLRKHPTVTLNVPEKSNTTISKSVSSSEPGSSLSMSLHVENSTKSISGETDKAVSI